MLETHRVSEPLETLEPVATPEDVIALAARVRAVHVSPLIQRYIVQIANATRVHPSVVLGMSPRAALALQRARELGPCSRAGTSSRLTTSRSWSHRSSATAALGAASDGRSRWQPCEGRLDEVLGQVPVPDLPTGRR